MSFQQGCQDHLLKKGQSLAIGVENVGYPHAKEWSWIPTLQHMKIKSKWIKNLNVRANTIKLLGENIGEKFQKIDWQWFLEYDTKTTENKL